MSDNGFNDAFLEKELFGGSSDELDAMDIDGPTTSAINGSHIDKSKEKQKEKPNKEPTGKTAKTESSESANVQNKEASEDADKAKQSTAAAENGKKESNNSSTSSRVLPTLDITLDDPAGSLTILHHAPIGQASVAFGYEKSRSYDIAPCGAMLNNYQIYSICATQNMRWVFTGGEDGYIKKWDFSATTSGKQMLTQGQRHPFVDGVTKAGVMASYWDNNDAQDDAANTLLLSPVYSLAVHSEAMWLLSGMKSGNIALWSVRHDEGRRIALLSKHKQPVSVLRISPDEYGLVSGSWDRAVLYWDLNVGKISRMFSGHSSQISDASFQPTWTYERYKEYSSKVAPSSSASLQENSSEKAAESEAFNPKTQGPVLMTTSIDGQCLLWDVRAPKPLPFRLEIPEKTPPWATSACWGYDGKHIYVGRRNNTVDEYEFGMEKPLRTLRLPINSGPVTSLAAMPNGRNLICASTDNVRMWDLKAHEESRRSVVPFQIIAGHHGGTVSNILVDPAGKYMITTSGNRGWDGTSNNACLYYEVEPSS